MNKKINNIKFTKTSEFYLMQGYYDESGQYHEEHFERVVLRDFPYNVRRALLSNLNKGNPYNALIYPAHRSIYVLLPMEHKDKFEQHTSNGEAKALLDFNAEIHAHPNNYLIWSRRNFFEE